MEEKIQQYLQELEEEKEINILLACETGSRAWGFPSPDSDFDIRLIYVHKLDWYLSINEKRDFIDRMYENNDLDFSGWELKKSLRLLKKSNPQMIERIQSPIIYKADAAFVRDILNISKHCYSKLATMHHYLNMARKMFKIVSGQSNYSLKKLFYALRTATLCQWILLKDDLPPINFNKAYKNLNLDLAITEKIDALIELKSTKPESYLHSGEPELFAFVKRCINIAEESIKTLPTGNCQTTALNLLLQNYVYQYEN